MKKAIAFSIVMAVCLLLAVFPPTLLHAAKTPTPTSTPTPTPTITPSGGQFVVLGPDNNYTDTLAQGATIYRNGDSGAMYGSDVEFVCGPCAEADFNTAVSQIGAPGATHPMCGYTYGIMNKILENNDLICAQNILSGAKYEIDMLSWNHGYAGCYDAVGGPLCAAADGHTSYQRYASPVALPVYLNFQPDGEPIPHGWNAVESGQAYGVWSDWGWLTSTPTIPTPTPSPTPTMVPFYATYGPSGADKVVKIGDMYVTKWTDNEGTAHNTLMNWQEALDWAANLVWLGKDDWRLPTGDYGGELSQICAAKDNLGAYTSDRYWSSTEYGGAPGYAWYVNFYDCYYNINRKTLDYDYVRAVRVGE